MKNFYFTISATNAPVAVAGESFFYKNGIDCRIPADTSVLNKKIVAIIGDGLYALESAAKLSGICKKIYIINESGKFFAPQTVSARILSLSPILPLYHTAPERILSEADRLTGISIRDKTNGNTAMINCSFILNAKDICSRVSTSVNM